MGDSYWSGMLVAVLIVIFGLGAILVYADHHQAFTFVELVDAMEADFENFVKQPLLTFGVLLLMQPVLIFTARRLSRMKCLQHDLTQRDHSGE